MRFVQYSTIKMIKVVVFLGPSFEDIVKLSRGEGSKLKKLFDLTLARSKKLSLCHQEKLETITNPIQHFVVLNIFK